MMLLGIDYGSKHIGLAIASGPLAEPLKNLQKSPRIQSQIQQICERLHVSKIIIGISEGRMAEETKKFANQLKQKLFYLSQ